jgi:hypothetical protein
MRRPSIGLSKDTSSRNGASMGSSKEVDMGMEYRPGLDEECKLYDCWSAVRADNSAMVSHLVLRILWL